mgnify:CR=1 FL=1
MVCKMLERLQFATRMREIHQERFTSNVHLECFNKNDESLFIAWIPRQN